MPVTAPVDFEVGNFDAQKMTYPGRYHVETVSINENGGKKRDQIILVVSILGGACKIGEGLFHPWDIGASVEIWISHEMHSTIHELAIAIGYVTKDQVNQYKAAGQAITYDFESFLRSANGAQFFVEYVNNEWKGEITPKAKKFYHMNAKAISNWHKNYAALAKYGDKAPKAPEGYANLPKYTGQAVGGSSGGGNKKAPSQPAVPVPDDLF